MVGEADFEGEAGAQADEELLKTGELVRVLDGEVRLGGGETGEDPGLLLLLLVLLGGWGTVGEGLSECESGVVEMGEAELGQEPGHDGVRRGGRRAQEQRHVHRRVRLVVRPRYQTAH